MEQKKNKQLTLGSLFDGSGGFPLGGILAGVIPKWSSEIEPFAIAVTHKRFPTVKHYGDVSKIKGSELEPVDIITFGSPCQNLSVAGKREGLCGDRSSLFYEAIRIVKEMRDKTNGEYPKYIIWENVPGAFSSNKGEDFRCVLEEVCSICDPEVSIPLADKWKSAGEILGNGYSTAWRQLDAQYWGVPQRRKRIYLVADFNGLRAGKILFESEGLSGYSQESFRAWQETTRLTTESIGETGEPNDSLMFENHSQDTRYRGPLDVAQTVSSTYGTGGNNQPFVVQTPKTLKIRSGCEGGGKGALIQDNLSATLGCNNDQTLFQPRAYGICSKDSNSMKSDNPNSGFYEADTSRTLDANGGNPSCNQGGIAVIEGNGSRPSHHGDGYKESDIMYTLNATETHAVAFAKTAASLSAADGPKGPSSQQFANPEENFVVETDDPIYAIDRESVNCGFNFARNLGIEENGVNSTLTARGPGAVAHKAFSSSKASFFTSAEEELANTLVATDYKDPPIVNEPDYIVRRLTPTECARLQGFPDWWCDDLGIENPTDEDMEFWRKVFDTYSSIMGTKPKTDAQIKKWIMNPHTDSAEYKLWGNGVALPNVYFVISGIVYYSQDDTQ